MRSALLITLALLISGCASVPEESPATECSFDAGVDADWDGIPDACDEDPSDGPLGDMDGDGIINRDDPCHGTDDDGDGIEGDCDDDPTDGPLADQDGDGVPNGDDACPGHDDAQDADGDGTADGCDDTPMPAEPEEDSRQEPAGNGTEAEPACGVSPGMSDTDGDGMGDDCDPDNNDGPLGDLDYDWFVNQDDTCHGFQDGHDIDFDGVPDGCDADFQDIPGRDPQAALFAHETKRACIAVQQDETKYRIGLNPMPAESSLYCNLADQTNAVWAPWTWRQGSTPTMPCIMLNVDNEEHMLTLGLVPEPTMSGHVCHPDEDPSKAVLKEDVPLFEQSGMVCISTQQDADHYRIRWVVGWTMVPSTMCTSQAQFVAWTPWTSPPV